jgi:multidrug efflux pump subunit AcrA (membrane-fusion protein)
MLRTNLAGAKSLFTFLFLFSALALFSACGASSSKANRGGNSNSNQASVDAGPIVTVTVAKAEQRPVPAYIAATGSLVANETSDVAPKVAGKIVNVYANVGQFISQGATIAKVDDRDARLQLAGAQARVNQQIAAVRQAEARLGLGPNGTFNASAIPEVRAANASYEQALAELRQAEANEQRYRDLVQTGDVAVITYEQYKTNRDTARARVNTARQQLEAAANAARQNNQAIASAEAAVAAARTEVGTAQQALADTVIKSPFPGFVSARPVAVGEYVSSATIIATILRTNPIKILMQISESDVPQVVLGRGVSVSVDAYPNRNFAGTVTAVNPAIDPVSRSATIEASIENGDNALRSGMFGTARIIREGGGTGVFVPKTAVYNDPTTNSYRAFVIVDGIAKLKVLQLGTEEGDFVQILTGLNGDETLATSNLEQLYEGARVAS